MTAGLLYLLGVWLHWPYAGGHIYSDLTGVFQERECFATCSSIPIPYVNGFIEYPILVSMFIYAMGLIGLALPVPTLTGYYIASVIFLAIPSILLVDETMKIGGLLGLDRRRVVRYLVITPTFVFLLLVNWYSIGVYFMLVGLRMFLEGRRLPSGVLFGLSAAANIITAAPAVGLLMGAKSPREAIRFAGSALITFAALNAPFVATNPRLWFSYWQFESNWYVEGSWMRFFIPAESPLRHLLFVSLAVALLGTIFVLSYKRSWGAITLAWLSSFALLFSSYVFTPQMNLMMLPFMALAPVTKNYLEFIAFDILTAAIIVLGYSQPAQVAGIVYNVGGQMSSLSPVLLAGILRSFWVGRFVFSGLRRNVFRSKLPAG